MIKKITNTTNFGIFENIPASPDYKDFNKFNLFYGFNGSGKSTLSHLFSLLESNTIESRFPNSKWNFLFSDNSKLSEFDDNNPDLNIKVFDKGFIERNIDWDNSVKGILLVSEDKKEEIQQLKEKRKEGNRIKEKIDKLEIVLNGDGKRNGVKGLIKDNSTFLTNAAKGIKAKFKLIEVEDTYLSNYDKRKLEIALKEKKGDIKKPYILKSEIENLEQAIKPQEKEGLEVPNLVILDTLLEAHSRISSILSTTVTSKVIEALKESHEKSKWAKEGLGLNTVGEKCVFCGNIVTQERVDELNRHFSDSFNKLQTSINIAIDWISNIHMPELPIATSLYKEFQSDYQFIIESIKTEEKLLYTVFNEWSDRLKEKLASPFELKEQLLPELDISTLMDLYDKAIAIINNHNKKFNDGGEIIKAKKVELEIEYIKDEIKRFDYYTNKSKEESEVRNKEQLEISLSQVNKDISDLNAKVSTESLGAEKFNKDLWKFLGRRDISLVPQESGGYKIQRNQDSNTKAKYLSEGEKTAIAFVYFINKLKEKSNKI